jgi:hypothetical protein
MASKRNAARAGVYRHLSAPVHHTHLPRGCPRVSRQRLRERALGVQAAIEQIDDPGTMRDLGDRLCRDGTGPCAGPGHD